MKHLVALVAVLSVFLLSLTAFGRPGGGQSFSGSKSGSSTSGGSRSYGGSSSSTSGSSRSSSWGGSSPSSSGGSRSTSTSSGSSWSSTSSGSTWSGSTTSSGSSYSGSSSGSTSSGYYAESGGSSHKFLWFLLGLGVLLFVFWGYGRYKQGQNSEWVARAEAEARAEEARRRRWASIEQALAGLRAADDAFSFVLFEDFLYALYAEAHFARGEGKENALELLAAYLSDGARTKLRMISNAPVSAIVIGGMKVIEVESVTGEPYVYATIVFTTNVSERGSDGDETAFYQEERWFLRRSTSARSRPPQRARTIDCPSCGAPRDKTVGGKCGYCGAAATEGASDWYVDDITVLHRESRGPMLTGTTEEIGTDLPTVVAPDVKTQLANLNAEDPTFAWPAFLARVERAFAAFHASWSSQELSGVRPYLSDNLFELQRYWVDTYRAQKLRNVTEGARIVTVHLARVTRDKWFYAITVRVFASCVDYTLDANGAVASGRRDKTRDYSEYWTFIRGVAAKGAPRADGACPSCGGPIAGINMAGKCGACGAKVTSGDFDWVLSRIEQDEVYESGG